MPAMAAKLLPRSATLLRPSSTPRPLRLLRPLSTSAPLHACKTPTAAAASKSTIPNTSIAIFRTLPALRAWRRTQLLAHRSVGLVPTMGALHAGHLSLVRAAAADNSAVLVSIFVNPAQFGVSEDLASYPHTWAADCAALRDLDRALADDGAVLGRVAAVFAPTTATMYPSGPPGQSPEDPGSFVTITPLATKLEGAARPSFFRGVATVVMKLLHAATPDAVYFGQKDVQQTVVVRRMVRDFLIDVRVAVAPTVRAHDGLALSSRNVYLGARRRKRATVLHDALKVAEAAYAGGARRREDVLGPAEAYARGVMAEQSALPAAERVRFEIGYLSLADAESLEEVDVVDDGRGAVLSGAFTMLPVEEAGEGEELGLNGGPSVRLIDNIILEPVGVGEA